MGLRVGQPIEIANTDPTFHNVHALPKENREFNHGLEPGIPPMRHTFTDAGSHGALQVRRARMDGGAHRRHAASVLRGDRGGRHVLIPGVPPGTYTVEAWHEVFGTRTDAGHRRRRRHVRRCRSRFGTAKSRPAGGLAPSLRSSARRRDAHPRRGRRHGHEHELRPRRCPTGRPPTGYQMFSFPLSGMVGGIFYEHGHRLIASVVGMLTDRARDLSVARGAARAGCAGWDGSRWPRSSSRARSAA